MISYMDKLCLSQLNEIDRIHLGSMYMKYSNEMTFSWHGSQRTHDSIHSFYKQIQCAHVSAYVLVLRFSNFFGGRTKTKMSASL